MYNFLVTTSPEFYRETMLKPVYAIYSYILFQSLFRYKHFESATYANEVKENHGYMVYFKTQ